MTSLLPRGTALESTLVRAIKADYPPLFDDGPLPDSVSTLLLAKCDPNIIGSPPLLPLGTAIRRGEDRAVELLLQYRADPQLREDIRELPLIIAVARGATKIVKILLDHRADPYSTMTGYAAASHGRRSSTGRRTTAMELTDSSSGIAALLQQAMDRIQISPQ